jgi:hypothetical protein
MEDLHGIALAWGELAIAGQSTATIIRREVNDAA